MDEKVSWESALWIWMRLSDKRFKYGWFGVSMRAMYGDFFCASGSTEWRHRADILNQIYFQVHRAFEINDAPMLRGCFE